MVSSGETCSGEAFYAICYKKSARWTCKFTRFVVACFFLAYCEVNRAHLSCCLLVTILKLYLQFSHHETFANMFFLYSTENNFMGLLSSHKPNRINILVISKCNWHVIACCNVNTVIIPDVGGHKFQTAGQETENGKFSNYLGP